MELNWKQSIVQGWDANLMQEPNSLHGSFCCVFAVWVKLTWMLGQHQ